MYMYMFNTICVHLTLPSLEQQQHFKLWQEYDDTEDSFCEADG